MKQGWEIKKLGEVCSILMGQSPSSDTYNEENEGLPFFQGNADFGCIHPTVRVFCNSPIRVADIEDILISVRAPIGAINIADKKCCIGRGLAAIKSGDSIIQSFVYHALIANREKLISQGTGSTFKSIGKSALNELVIPVPPLPEQEKIVAELDCLSGIIEKKRQQLKELDALAQSIFYEMFGDPVTNEKGWEVKSIKEIGKVITGNTPSRSVSDYYNSKDIEWIKTDNIESGKIHPTTAKEYLSKDGMMKGRVVESGAILVTCIAGSIASIGGCCITDRKVAFNQQINAVVPMGDINSLYLYYCLILSKRLIQDSASNGMKHLISKSIFEQIPISLPPHPLQQTFASKIEAIEKQKALIKQSLGEVETLFNARMQEYFG